MAAICAALAACGKLQDQPIRVAIIADPLAPFATGPTPGPAATLLRGATAEGLVSLDADGKVIPALADRWIVTDDGLSYILRMRDGTWADGARLTGESARAALQRAIAAQAGTPLGVDLRAIEEVRATAGRVIEVRLSRPVPDML
ncbi:MAG TPA: ABC transporter substrate-binding protein, partial [Novosphingobium sp.]|nr:ABC transporter substrate-binding protein [Novosphingobium sp.]